MELPRKRGRKRKLKDTQDEDGVVKNGGVKPVISLLGRYLKKLFEGKYYIGKVISYDSGLYRVEYDDGDCEDLDSGEIRPFLIQEDGLTKALVNKKRKLDDMICRKVEDRQKEIGALVNTSDTSEKHVEEEHEEKEVREGDSDVDAFGEEGHEAAAEVVTVPTIELPPSSATIRVPEEYVSHLFSVYSFLRSFSIRLFLSPFGLDDFVGALNCPTRNTLLDAIHLALLQALRHHLEETSADVSDLSSKCLRCIDWGLLDSVTWPVYVVRYAMVMGYTKGNEWKGFYGNAIEREYYSLSTIMKLVILQMLCDDVLNSAELRQEIDMREEEEGDSSDIITDDLSETLSRRVHPRFSKTSVCKDINKLTADNQTAKSNYKSADQDSNSDECRLCGMDGTLLCCDGCPSAYHSRCIGVNKLLIPDGAWYCPECTVDKTGHIALASLQSAEMFGIDSEKRVFLGTCNHLLVLKAFPDEEPFLRYYSKNDIKKVAQVLYSSKLHDTVYSRICERILKFWNIPEESFERNEKVEIEETVPNHESSFSGAVQKRLTVNSNIHDATSYSLANGSDGLHATSLRIRLKNPFQARVGINERKVCIYSGSSFKHNCYTNHYVHGNFAASAAANLAVLSSEENTILGVQASANVKKAMLANVLLQVKAFGSAASRFFWPNSEKKYAEVPRERCGWCLSCQGAATSKKACMLNAACLNAHRGAMKFLSGFQACKIEDACLASIATYILYMEDSFNVLLVGPFMSANYRKQWRNNLRHASTCYTLKSFLLELEGSIRDVALSSDWLKLVGDSIIDSFDLPNSSLTPAPAPKRGRRKTKLLSSSEASESEDKDDINWWRGGKMSKLIFQKGKLPSQILKKTARQGGKNKIHGVDYGAESEIPRRSRQLIWRSSVEMCKNTSQLALQVRILDHHLRWSDLNRPDQSSHEGKGSDSEASVFRNGVICDKRTVGPKIFYAVVFGNQRHLPLRIMKTVTDLEQGQDGKEKHWFPEMRIPLYLIKEFEAGMTEACPLTVDRTTKNLSILQMKQLKDARRNIFSYLASKRDNLSKCSCTACPLEVLIRDAVKCNDCQGYCHVDCTLSSKVPASMGAGIVTTISCKQCYFVKPLTQGGSRSSPTSPLLVHAQGQNRSAVKDINGTQSRSVNQHLSTVGVDKSHYAMRPNATDSTPTQKKKKKIMSWGLIWKKKPTENNREFLRTNLLLRGIVSSESPKPVCALCQKPYIPELTYIRCETCKKWYHGDAVELDKSKISELLGFKCCKCRRIRSPDCPYLDIDIIKPGVNGSLLDPDLEISGLRPLGDTEPLVEESSSPLYLNTDDIFMQSDDPLLFSLARVEQVTEPFIESDIGWDTAESGAKKLPVRKLVKNDNSSNYLEAVNGPVCYDSQLTNNVSYEAAQDELMFDLDSIDYEDMEFEPHTYFSMTELLEDGGADAYHAPINDPGLCPTSSASNLDTVGIHEPQHSSAVQVNFEHQDNQIQKCDSCQSAVSTPDLLQCELCGLSIHRDCSPWIETTTSLVDKWKCGSCREWQ